jgi:hypothetical protein
MDEPTANDSRIADPLRLDRCPDCAYLLTGLPASGVCPECGFQYSGEMIVLYGWASGVRIDDANQQPTALKTAKVWLKAAFVLAVVWLPALTLGSPIPLGMAIVVTVAAGHTLYRRHRLLREGPGPVQLRLVPAGFGQRNGVGPLRLRPWRRGQRLHIRKAFRMKYRIRSYRWYQPAILGWRHIDFMFHADSRTIARIRERVDRWQ